MESRISIVTLGVADQEKSRKFYEAMGWQESRRSQGDIIFYQGPGHVIALYPREKLAEDAQVPADGQGFRGITLAQNASSEAEVDEILAQAEKAGGTIPKPAQQVFWGGYSGYFADPDGNLWEVAFNPHWSLNADRTLTLPKD